MQTVDAPASNTGFFGGAKVQLLIQLIVAVVVAVAIVTLLTPFGAAASPDSIYYLDIATHIHNGEGVSSTDHTLAYAGENRVLPNTTWPPLYPALLALGPVPPGAASAAIWSTILLAATLFFVQRILSRFLSWRLAMMAALPLALTVPLLTIHTYAWSEQLFIAILLALLLAAQNVLAGAGRVSIAAVALLLVLAFYTRYIGLLFFPLLPLLYLLGGRARHLLPTFVVACIACGLAVVVLLAYNLQISGSLTGTVRQPADTSLIEQVRRLLAALVPIFISPGRSLFIVLVAVGAAAPLLYVLYAQHAPQIARATERRYTWGLAFGMTVYYVACVVGLRSMVAFDEIDVRLVGVVVPYLWIGCVALTAGFAPNPLKFASGLVATLLLATLTINGYLVLFEVRANWRASGSPWFRVNTEKTYNNYNLPPSANPYRQFMALRTNADSLLVTDQPHVFQYTTGLRAFQLPAELAAADIRKMAGFPARSYIILSKKQQPEVELALQQRGARATGVTDAGPTVLLHLPLELSTVGN